ncbi:MAG: phytanoyl-CoA dioxygenase family protein [Emcibacter sp.]|nr:phytanoyl-CoA dioxygenase family protein [Emcibacter sp.]
MLKINNSIDSQIQRHLRTINRDGFAIISDLLPKNIISDLGSTLSDHFDKTPYGEGLFYGKKTKRMGRIFSRSLLSHKLATHPVILGIMDDILGPYCQQYQIHLTQAIRIDPGETRQILHRDDDMLPCPAPDINLMANVMWALEDFTVENGATVVWPGSHKFPLSREAPEEELTQAVMKKGSALIWLGTTQHCGGENRSQSPRSGLTISYSLGWLRQAENQFLAYPPEIAKKFPSQIQDLIGYKVHRPVLGYYEGQEPSILFKERPDNLAAQDLFPQDVAQLIAEHEAA